MEKVLTQLDCDDIVSLKYLIHSRGLVKVVVQTQYPYFTARLIAEGKTYKDAFNDIEPYDRMTHVFYVCRRRIKVAKTLRFVCTEPDGEENEELYYDIENNPVYESAEELIKQYDNAVTVLDTQSIEVADGVTYKKFRCTDKDGKSVMAFALFVDTKKASFAAGTPDDGEKATDCRMTVEGEADAAIKNGKNVVAATNADFFDMFGNSAPSGLCVKDGKIIANAKSKRCFFGLLKDGTPIISSLALQPEIKDKLYQAVGGLQYILKDGELHDVALLEPFGYVRHPRTAAGICEDGTAIILVIDGRIPDYSNGASLVDVAVFLKQLGAIDVLNLDGGGSSIMIIRRDGVFKTMNNPADLFRPTERLIREGYNSILVVR